MARPVALVTNFSKTAFPRLLAEIEAGPRPPIADWYIGTYGISKPMADAIAAARFRYAPVFAIQPRTSKRIRERRRVRKAETELLDPEFAGKIPGGNAVLPPANQRAWEIEFGRRYRDYIRRQRSAGVRIDTWQFDEILGKCATSSAHRAFAGGILHGLANGRPELDDQPEKGFVWFGRQAAHRHSRPCQRNRGRAILGRSCASDSPACRRGVPRIPRKRRTSGARESRRPATARRRVAS
jgi:hypothetical protein